MCHCIFESYSFTTVHTLDLFFQYNMKQICSSLTILCIKLETQNDHHSNYLSSYWVSDCSYAGELRLVQPIGFGVLFILPGENRTF